MTRNATITREVVLALLSLPQTATMTHAEIGAACGVNAQAAGNVLRSLLSSSDVVATKSKTLPTLYYALSPQGKAPDDRVPPFKWDIWTQPLRYNLLAHAELAMASRSA
jgi:hypothetical protein